MIEPHVIALRNIQNASRQAIVPIMDLLWIDFDRFAFFHKRDFVLLRRGRELCLFNIWILAAHSFLLLWPRQSSRDILLRPIVSYFVALRRRRSVCLRTLSAARHSSALRPDVRSLC